MHLYHNWIAPIRIISSSQFNPLLPFGSYIKPIYYSKESRKKTTFRALKLKFDLLGINYDSSAPGLLNHLFCPKGSKITLAWDGRRSVERSLSFYISHSGKFAMWRCFHDEYGMSGQESAVSGNGVHALASPAKPKKQMTTIGLGLIPLRPNLIAYFAGRMISKDVLDRNGVMQLSSYPDVIAFTYKRNGILVSCKYRSLGKRFWQKCVEKIWYGVDDIVDADDVIIVEGEVDKLSMEEAGFVNCVSVPDGAQRELSYKELPSPEKDSGFKYVWNCRDYLSKASRIILATDGDLPGNVLAEELARRLGYERCWRVKWPMKDDINCFNDANEVLVCMGPSALRDIVDKAEPYRVHNFNHLL